MRARISQEMRKLHLKLSKAGLDLCARPTILLTEDFFAFRYTPDPRGAEALAQVSCYVCGVPEIRLRVMTIANDVEAEIANAAVRYANEGAVVN
ncbi:MAG TPA: hypothetical protein VGE08_14525 [Steroidobacter sp.]|uniref:hypothetical protein n=1 Tax=Steroidobacter sp. TaxID=1978227 RepID=UPI002EDA7869